MRITIVEVNSVLEYPPVMSLIRVLLKQGHQINLITRDADLLPNDISDKIIKYDIGFDKKGTGLSKLSNRIGVIKYVRECTATCMKTSDVLWTTSANTIKVLGKQVLEYKNVLQLMELVEDLKLFRGHINVPIAEIARKSWKVVVPEINRAFIEQTWWNLKELPFVLPNKPFNLVTGALSENTKKALQTIQEDQSKIMIYLGGIWPDRDLTVFAKAAQNAGDYKLYIVGQPYGNGKIHLNNLINNYGAQYLGSFPAPQHLAFLPYAKVGLLPYKAAYSRDVSILNALYCAPNKIFEYAGFGIPMIGSYVPGLLMPFERYGIGLCCKEDSTDSVLRALNHIDRNHDEMSKNCRAFFDATDIESIIKAILT